MTFKDLNLIEPILRALDEEGYEKPTPIQAQAIPHALEGRDLLAVAQTGTGKTAAFSIPMLQELADAPRDSRIKGLVLTPTRELAIQIEESLAAYGRHLSVRNAVIFGGVSQRPQEQQIRRGVDLLVATPGRLLDLMNQGIVDLQHIQFFVLDEADRMLDMGFINDVKKVIKHIPAKRHTMFFSATMPDEIADLANSILSNPVEVEVTPPATTVEKIKQSVYFVEKKKKRRLLQHLLEGPEIMNALVFTRTKHGANRVVKELSQNGVTAMAIHGNKSQTARQKALGDFKDGKLRVLVATDIAARGIDIDELSHVINYDLPNISESYVHRIGRTGRAGAEGVAIAFCDYEEAAYLQDIQKLIGLKVPVVEDHPYPLEKMPDFSRKLIPPKMNQREPREDRGGGRRRDDSRGERKPKKDRNRNDRPARGERNDRPERSDRPDRPDRPSENGEGNDRSRPSRRGGRGGRREGGSGENSRGPRPERNGEGNPENGANQQRRDNRPSRPAKQNDSNRNEDSQKSGESSGGDENSWSKSIFTENRGKKGFVIRSDRDEKSRNTKSYGKSGGGNNSGGGNRRGGGKGRGGNR